MKIGKRGVLTRSCKFWYLDQHASIKNHDFPPKLLKFMTFSWQFRFPTQIQDFSGLLMTVVTLGTVFYQMSFDKKGIASSLLTPETFVLTNIRAAK